jgi:hypothetical protein
MTPIYLELENFKSSEHAFCENQQKSTRFGFEIFIALRPQQKI